MIAQLTGTIIYNASNPVVVDIHGVGYGVFMPTSIAAKLVLGSTTTIFTHTHVREDALQLFGFLTLEEQRLFELLVTVSGVGPKTALTVMDRGAKAVQKAIISHDVSFFTAVPRLGTKNAQKIIIELKNKLGSTTDFDLSSDTSETTSLIDALKSMGFETKDIRDVIGRLPPDASIEEKIKQAIRILGKAKII